MKLFELGQVVATPSVLALAANGVNLSELLDRHVSGDWGDLDEEDKAENEFSLRHGFRILSSYKVGSETVWIISASDRSSTCVLRPDEY